jgi:transcriptional regulator with XRE-family HTH domain
MRDLRQVRGMSQARLAELSGVSERTVRALEGGTVGRPQHESLRRIAAVPAYGEGHGQRLVQQWTGTSSERTSQEIGVPEWESLYRRLSFRRPADGGQVSSLMGTVTVGADRMPMRSVQGDTAASAERRERLQTGHDGTAQTCLHDFIGVFGIQWEWEGEAPTQAGRP